MESLETSLYEQLLVQLVVVQKSVIQTPSHGWLVKPIYGYDCVSGTATVGRNFEAVANQQLSWPFIKAQVGSGMSQYQSHNV